MVHKKKLKYVPWIIGFGLFIENIDITVINTSLPQIAKTLNANPIDLKIGITSYLLTLAMLIPISGYIADRLGTQKTFSLSFFFFILGSVICGFATNLMTIIIGRLVQGVGGSLMTPVGRLILTKMFSHKEFVKVFSSLVILGQIGTAIGPVIGGMITNFLNWRFIFFVNVPISIFALILVQVFIDNIKSKKKEPFDLLGFLIFGTSMSLIILPITLITQRAPVNHTEYYFLGVGILLLIYYYFYARKILYPSIELKLFAVRTFRFAVLGNFITRLGLGGIPFLLPLLFQLNFGLNAFESSLFLLPYGLGFLFAKFILKKLLNKYGFKNLLSFNATLLAVLLLIISLLKFESTVFFITILMYILGIFSSLQFSYLSILTYVDIKSSKLSKATSLASVVQQVSIGLGVCLVAGALVFFNPHSFSNFVPLEAFEDVFYLLSMLSLLPLLCFTHLNLNDGNNVLNKNESK